MKGNLSGMFPGDIMSRIRMYRGKRKRAGCAHLEHVELLRRVVVRPGLGLLHPVRSSLYMLHEEPQSVQLLMGAALIDASGKLW